MDTDQKTIDLLVQRIVDVVDPLRMILFGSGARGGQNPDSDLDVMVIVSEGVHRRKTAQKIYMHLLDFERSVDVVVATEADLEAYGDNFSLVYYPALREGKEVYVTPEYESRNA